MKLYICIWAGAEWALGMWTNQLLINQALSVHWNPREEENTDFPWCYSIKNDRYFKVYMVCKLPLKWIKPIIDTVFSSITLRITIFQIIQAVTNPMDNSKDQLIVVLLMNIKEYISGKLYRTEEDAPWFLEYKSQLCRKVSLAIGERYMCVRVCMGWSCLFHCFTFLTSKHQCES